MSAEVFFQDDEFERMLAERSDSLVSEVSVHSRTTQHTCHCYVEAPVASMCDCMFPLVSQVKNTSTKAHSQSDVISIEYG